jgi:hypothetical protein
MNRVETTINATISICVFLLPAYAGVVHKWIDEKGITHYSDEAPVSETSEMTQIELPRTTQATAGAHGDYYSIANQWERMLRERLERARTFGVDAQRADTMDIFSSALDAGFATQGQYLIEVAF